MAASRIAADRDILVLGTGVIGLNAAHALLGAGYQRVTLFSKEPVTDWAPTPSKDYASAGSYAMWWPVNHDRALPWSLETRRRLTALAAVPNTGIILRRAMALKVEPEDPWYANLPSFRHARPDELSPQYADGHVFDDVPVTDPLTYLRWLKDQVSDAGGTFVQETITSFAECPSQYDIIVNCTGLGARSLVADSGITPQSIQVVIVRQTGFNRLVFDDSGPNKTAVIAPHLNYIKLGGVYEPNTDSQEVRPERTADIIARCRAMAPDLKVGASDILNVYSCVRADPAAWWPRVDAEEMDGRKVVHAIGLNGMGYICSGGIAQEVVELVGKA